MAQKIRCAGLREGISLCIIGQCKRLSKGKGGSRLQNVEHSILGEQTCSPGDWLPGNQGALDGRAPCGKLQADEVKFDASGDGRGDEGRTTGFVCFSVWRRTLLCEKIVVSARTAIFFSARAELG